MGKLADIIGGTFLDGFAKVVSLWKVDPTKAMENQAEMAKIAAEMQDKILDAATEQIKAVQAVNQAEAASGSVFVAGWRPFIGWVCGSGLAFQFLLAPLATWITQLCGYSVLFPTLDSATLMTLVMGMLGLGGLRTYEKINGVESKGMGGN